MALLFMDSFDHYVTADLLAKWSSLASIASVVPTITVSNGRHGSGSFRLTATSVATSGALANVQRTLVPVDPTTGVCGFAFAISTVAVIGTSGLSLLSFRDTGTAQLTLRVNADLTLSVLRGAPGEPGDELQACR